MCILYVYLLCVMQYPLCQKLCDTLYSKLTSFEDDIWQCVRLICLSRKHVSRVHISNVSDMQDVLICCFRYNFSAYRQTMRDTSHKPHTQHEKVQFVNVVERVINVFCAMFHFLLLIILRDVNRLHTFVQLHILCSPLM